MHVNRMFGRVRRGITMLEVGAGLAVAAVGFAGFALMQNDATQATRADASGAMMRTVVEAAVHYVQSRRSELLSSTTAGGAPIVVPVARRSATEPVPENSLQSAGFLPDNWIDRNAYGHHHALLIRQAENQELRMLVVQQGGRPVPRQADLVRAAARIGPGSGFVPAENVPGAPTTHATGLGGVWSLPRSEWTVTQDGVQFQPSLARNAAYVVFPNTPAGGGTGGGEGGGSGGGSGWSPSMGQTIMEMCITTSRVIQEHQIPGATKNIEYILVGGGGGGGSVISNGLDGSPTILTYGTRTIVANGGQGGRAPGPGQTGAGGSGQGFGHPGSANPTPGGARIQFPNPNFSVNCPPGFGRGPDSNGGTWCCAGWGGGGAGGGRHDGTAWGGGGAFGWGAGSDGGLPNSRGGSGGGIGANGNNNGGNSGNGGNGGSGGGGGGGYDGGAGGGGGGSGYLNVGNFNYSGGTISITIGAGGTGGNGSPGIHFAGEGAQGVVFLRLKN